MVEPIHAIAKRGGLTRCGLKVDGKLASIWPSGVTCKKCLQLMAGFPYSVHRDGVGEV